MPANIIPLAQAMADSPTAVYQDRQRCDQQYGPGLFDQAVKHHERLRLAADIKTGTVRNRNGWISQFVGYDWAKAYEEAPHHVWFDFLRGVICNSASRLARGLPP